MNCIDNKNKECCGRTTPETINWSNKVLKMDKYIRDEIGMDAPEDIGEILLSIQIKGSDSLEPAFIRCEDDTFLDVSVLGMNGFTPTAILKKDIQSIGVVGGKSPVDDEDKDEDGNVEVVNEFSKDHFLNSYC